MKVSMAALQMVSGPEVDANLAVAERLVGEAAAQGAQLVLLPEYFCLMGNRDTDKVDIQEGEEGPLQDFLADCARRHALVVVGGTVPLRSPKRHKVLNSSLVYGPDGRQLARYDKIHLFGFQKGEESFNESSSIHPGRTPVVCDVWFREDEAGIGHAVASAAGLPGSVGVTGAAGGGQGQACVDGEGAVAGALAGAADEASMQAAGRLRSLRLGLSVCYDLRFPELYRQMSPLDVIMMPAAFTYTTGEAHWGLLLRARAVENQCYVLASAQGGTHPSGRRTWGHSMMVDPWGEVQSVLPAGEGVVMGTLDTARISEVRQSLPALAHRVL
ncbi:MAG: carbon-nitrogen hydrolase family protein [Lautropia sp.]|nr:carbon-nitrogen hydrolase family protein [Lautropia sp.]